MNSSIIGLILKVQDAIDVENFRPITVINFKFKIITKVLVDHFTVLAPKLINPQKCGFVRGRHILDYIGTTSECVNLLTQEEVQERQLGTEARYMKGV